MAIIDDILDDTLARTSHDAMVTEICDGGRFTAVCSQRLGLAYAFRQCRSGGNNTTGRHARRPFDNDRSARQLARLAGSRDLGRASTGVAAINSLIEPDWPKLDEGKAYELILARGENRNVTVVGHFPFVDRLRPKFQNLWVLELEPTGDDLPASAAARVIPQSDVVAITGTTLINHTLDDILALSRGRFVVVLGPSTPLSPVLFDYGVDVIGGVVIDNPDATLTGICAGTSLRDLSGLRYVTWTKDGRTSSSRHHDE